MSRRERALQAGGLGGSAAFVYETGPGSEIAGLLGYCGTVLDAIGVIVRGTAPPQADRARCGPTGGEGGQPFDDASVLKLEPELRPALITVHGDRFVDSITLHYDSPSGGIAGGEQHGGDGGILHELALEPGEVIAAVSGNYGALVDRLVIETSRRKEALVAGGHYRPMEPRGSIAASSVTKRPRAARSRASSDEAGRSSTLSGCSTGPGRVARGAETASGWRVRRPDSQARRAERHQPGAGGRPHGRRR